ncbi:hypothetical protein [Yoonia sp. MH D7]
MQSPKRPRRPASRRAKIAAFGTTAILLAITGYMLLTGPSSDFVQPDDNATLDGVDDAVQGVAEGLLGD